MLSCHSDYIPRARPRKASTSSSSTSMSYEADGRCHQTSFPSLSTHLRWNLTPSLPFPITDAERTLQRNAREIESLKAAVQALEAEQSTLSRYIAESESLLSPIRKLPVEILAEIFSIHCSRGTGNIVGDRPYCPSLRLSQVCHFWRQVMFSRSELWAKLEVRLEQMTKGTLELLKLFLKVSKGATLSLRVTSGYWNPSVDDDPTLSWKVFELLLENAGRWRSATLRLDYQLFLNASAKVLEGLVEAGGDATDNNSQSLVPGTMASSPFTRLEHLDVSWFDCRIASVYSERRPIRLFENVSSLKSLTIPHYDEFFVFPLSGLHTLKLTNVHRHPNPILSQCTNLTRLSIMNYAIRDSGGLGLSGSSAGLTLSTITELDIQLSSYFESLTLSTLFSTLILPNLTSLTVSEPFHRYTDRRTWSREAFKALQNRSGFKLEKLRVVEVNMSGEEMVEVMEMSGGCLRDVTFYEWEKSGGRATRVVLDGLCVGMGGGVGGGNVLAPGLKYLRLRVDETMVERVGEVVEARSASCIPLEEVLLVSKKMEMGEKKKKVGVDPLGVLCAFGTRVVVRHAGYVGGEPF